MGRDDWREVRVSDLISEGALAINDGYRVRNSELGAIGIPFVRGGDIGDGWIQTEVADHILPEFQERVTNKLSQEGDVAFITKGTVGRVGYLRAGQPSIVFAPQVCYWRVLDPAVLDQRFLYFLLNGAEFQANLDSVKTHGSMVADYVSLSDQRQFRLRLPRIEAQRAIGSILGSLDDKIELNRRTNETLEAMAQTLFRSWFVDFDPERAKVDHLTSNLDATAKQFPDSFEPSALGPLPKGWRVVELAEVAEIIDCLHTRKPIRQSQGSHLLQLEHIRDDGLVDVSVPYLISDEDYRLWISRMEASAGDCVITNVGRVGAVAQLPKGLRAALGRNMTGIRCRSEFPFPTFLLQSLLSEPMREEIERKTDAGTILDALNVRSISRLRLVCPPRNLVARFEAQVRPIREMMESNLEQSRTLMATRDALLPKLLSGELRVAPEELVEVTT